MRVKEKETVFLCVSERDRERQKKMKTKEEKIQRFLQVESSAFRAFVILYRGGRMPPS